MSVNYYDSDDETMFKSKEEYNLTFLYMMSMIYDIVRVYYSYQLFLDNNKVVILIMVLLSKPLNGSSNIHIGLLTSISNKSCSFFF